MQRLRSLCSVLVVAIPTLILHSGCKLYPSQLADCAPETDDAFCKRLGKTSGPAAGRDNCDADRTVADCGKVAGAADAATTDGAKVDGATADATTVDAPTGDAGPPGAVDGGAADADAAIDSAVRDADAPDAIVAGDASDGSTFVDGATDAAGDATVVIGGDNCSSAPEVFLSDPNQRMNVSVDLATAGHTVTAPCATNNGREAFYLFALSKPAIVYADTFGASVNTVLYFTSYGCSPLGSTMANDTVCSDDACGTTASQVTALLTPGRYKLGISGRTNADVGNVTVHLAWAYAPSGTNLLLPSGSSVQTGTTGGGSNITGLSVNCHAAGPENGYWWTSCPGDPGGTLSASTCGGATWETTLELQVPGANPYTCNIDACGLQAELTRGIPAGAGLRVLSIDGESGSDQGTYRMTVSRP